MKRKLTLTIIFFLNSLVCFSQNDSTKVSALKSNPIIYWEAFIGPADGLLLGTALNYQFNKSLITARYSFTTKIDFGGDIFIFLPSLEIKETYNELALLYGYRYIKDGHSLSVSSGLSYNARKFYSTQSNVYNDTYKYVGFPFEVNFKWFNAVKKRYRIYYIIPIGEPTAFSRSFGFKLTGNFSKFSYVGLGFTYGLGLHKVYNK
jgi:hypothetical protein